MNKEDILEIGTSKFAKETEAKENHLLKDKIITAARTLFVKKGYYKTNIPDIVKSANVSIGAMYHYFEGKENLAKKIHDNSVQLLEEKFRDQILIHKSAKLRCAAFINLMFEWTRNDPVMVEYLLFARPQDIFNEKISICSKEGLVLVMDIIIYGQKNKEIMAGDPFIYYTILSGTVSRYIELYLDNKLNHPITSYVEDAKELIWKAIRAV